jgi:hypothetical protein
MKSVIIFVMSVLLMTGCSVFKKSRKMDMTPFSENASTLFGEAVKVSRPFQWKYCRPYISIPEYQNMTSRAKPIIDALQGIVYYSNQVVAINNAGLSETNKNRKLASFLSEALDKAVRNQKVDSLQLDKLGVDEILDKMRKSETYLNCIAAGSPIVNSIVVAMQNRLNEIQDGIPAILGGFNREIERDYGETRKNFNNLRQLQEQMMISMTLLYHGRLGNTTELDSLLRQNYSLRQFFTAGDKATPAQLNAAESYLIERLNQIDVMLKQLNDARSEYIAKQEELIEWQTQLEDKIIIARTSMTIWAQSHRNLGAGIPVPPLIDVAGFTSGLLGKAAKTIIP